MSLGVVLSALPLGMWVGPSHGVKWVKTEEMYVLTLCRQTVLIPAGAYIVCAQTVLIKVSFLSHVVLVCISSVHR